MNFLRSSLLVNFLGKRWLQISKPFTWLALLLATISVSRPALSTEIYVPSDYFTIQEAIEFAVDGDLVFVAPGTYFENINFLGKEITLSSEGGADVTVIDGSECTTGAETCSVVTMINDETELSILDGFTLRNGLGSNYCSPGISCRFMGGGGVYCSNVSSTIINCIITGNTLDQEDGGGGGIHCYNSSLTIINCLIFGNYGLNGGSIYSQLGSSLTIKNCTIMENEANVGGGIFCVASSLYLSNSLISTNMSNERGGGVYCFTNSPSTISNSAILDNYAELDGGGIACRIDSPLTIKNCTVSGNNADRRGGGISCDSSISNIENSILWGNSAPTYSEIFTYESPIFVTYSDVQGGWTGDGNIDADPMFVGGDDVHLTIESPCIDAGNPDPIYIDACIPPAMGTERNDMGAYGGPLVCDWLCLDIDADGFYDHFCGGLDCDDKDRDTYPGAFELCDGKDTDCDGTIPSDESDTDGDGWKICSGDCHDADPMIHPGAGDPCDGVDQGCDGLDDEIDLDLDGYMICAGDCDDLRSDVNPDQEELCDDGIDNDCDGAIDMIDVDCLRCIDLDGDGYGSPASGVCPFPQRDCDDSDPYVNPGAEEGPPINPYCSDSLDNDCDGLVDAMDPDCQAPQPCSARVVPISRPPMAVWLIPGLALALLGRRVR